MSEPTNYLSRPDVQPHLYVMDALRRWDPIGVISDANRDEYDSYSPHIVRMLDAGADAEKVFAHLRQIVTVSMGMTWDASLEKRTREVAVELVERWRRDR